MTTPWEELRSRIEATVKATAPANEDVQSWAKSISENVALLFQEVEDDWDEDYVNIGFGNTTLLQRHFSRRLRARTDILQREGVTVPVNRAVT